MAGTGAATRRYGTALRSDAKLRQRYDSTDTHSEGVAQFGGAEQRQSSEWICNGEGEVELSLAWRRQSSAKLWHGIERPGIGSVESCIKLRSTGNATHCYVPA